MTDHRARAASLLDYALTTDRADALETLARALERSEVLGWYRALDAIREAAEEVERRKWWTADPGKAGSGPVLP